MAINRRFVAKNGLDNNALSIENLGAVGATFSLSGANSVVLTSTGATNVTLPTSGTLATLTDNVASATILQTARTISATGDLTWTSAAFNGSANVTGVATLATVNSNVGQFAIATFNAKGLATAATNLAITGDATGTSSGASLALTLANSGVTAASYGSASSVGTFTVDAKGRLTTASSTAIAIATSAVTTGTFADARIAASNVTQHQGSLSIAETQIPDGALLARNAGNETITGNWTFNNVVVGVTPTIASHLATKDYVDTVATGLSFKSSVRATTTANITLSGTQTIDGVALVAGNRVLVKDQTTGSQNGIYVVAAGAWARASDFDGSPAAEVAAGAYMFVREGTLYANSGWVLSTPDPITIGTTSLSFTQFTGLAQLTAGNGLIKTGSTLDVVGTAGRIVSNPTNIDLATVGTAGTYNSVTTDAYGRVTSGTNSTTGTGTTYVTNTSPTITNATLSGTTNFPSSSPVRAWSVADTDIDGLISGTTAGIIFESPAQQHFTIGIRSNDVGDGFQVLSKGIAVNAATDPYTTLAFEVKADGNMTWAGTATGIGSGITSLNASNLASGTVPDARISGSYTGLTNLSGSGSVTFGSFSGSGAALTALNGSNISTGTVADARLSTNVALLNTAQTFTASKTFNLPLVFASNLFDINGSGPGGQATGLYISNLEATVGTTNNPTFTSVIVGQISTSRSIALSVDTSGYLYGMRSHSNAGTYTFQSKTRFADQLTTARTIALSGAATGTATSFDGSANITIPVTSLNAANLSGTVPDAAISGAYSGITSLTANNFISTSTVGLRMKDSTAATGYGTLFYADGSDFYLLLTNNNDANGTFNGLRPFRVNKATGNVTLSTTVTATNPIVGSITGNAAFATNSTRSTLTNSLANSDGTTFLTPSSAIASSGGRGVDLAPNTYSQGLFSEFKNSSLFGFGGSYTGLLTYANWVGTTASTGDVSYQLAFSPPTANATTNPSLRIRSGIDAAWGPWNVVLHSTNFNSYAPTLTGGGASGTWAINISGSAAQVGGYSVNAGAVANTVVIRDGNAYTYLNYINSNTSNGESVGSSIQQVITTNGGDNFYRKASIANFTTQILNTGGTGTGVWNFQGAGAVGTAGQSGTLVAHSISNNAATMSFHKAGQYAINMGLDSDNVFRIGGWSDGANVFRITTDTAGNTVARGALSGSRVWAGYDSGVANSVSASDWFRSSGNTGWYNATYAGGVYMTDSTWVQAYNSKGFYAAYYGGTVAGSSYGAMRLDSGTGGYSGIYLSSAAGTVTGMYDGAGNGGDWDPTTGWHFYWLRANTCLGIGGSNTVAGYRARVNGALYADGDITAFSDRRVKDDIQTIPNGLAKVEAMRGVSYIRNDNGDLEKGKRSVGVIAQEVEAVVPELVYTNPDDDMKGVNYGQMAGVFIEAIKELSEKVKALEAKLAKYEG